MRGPGRQKMPGSCRLVLFSRSLSAIVLLTTADHALQRDIRAARLGVIPIPNRDLVMCATPLLTGPNGFPNGLMLIDTLKNPNVLMVFGFAHLNISQCSQGVDGFEVGSDQSLCGS